MQPYHTYRHFGQTVLAWILAFLVLCAGAAGTGTAFADDVTPDSSADETSELYHFDPEELAALGPGLHEVEVFVDGEPVSSRRLYVPRDWDAIMTPPTAEQIEDAADAGRSTYVTFYPLFDKAVTALTEYAMDFSIDDMDRGTYFSTVNATVDPSALTQQGITLLDNYGDPTGLYGGFQCWDDGKTGVIMTVWDVLCQDAQGSITVIKAKPLYVDDRATVLNVEEGSEGEGNFQQFKMEYPWQPEHPYRMLIQMGTNEASGNATATMQVCDLITCEWTKLVTWDLGYPSGSIKTEYLCGFLENYDSAYAGSVRSANFSNIRGRDAESGEWVAADTVHFMLNNGMDSFDYVGSYQVGADDSSFYAITSGVDGLCTPTEQMTYRHLYPVVYPAGDRRLEDPQQGRQARHPFSHPLRQRLRGVFRLLERLHGRCLHGLPHPVHHPGPEAGRAPVHGRRGLGHGPARHSHPHRAEL